MDSDLYEPVEGGWVSGDLDRIPSESVNLMGKFFVVETSTQPLCVYVHLNISINSRVST